jgi:hypothetical protein
MAHDTSKVSPTHEEQSLRESNILYVHIGHSVNLAWSLLAVAMAGILMYDNWRKNKARDAVRYAHPDGRDFDYRNATTAVSKAHCHMPVPGVLIMAYLL